MLYWTDYCGHEPKIEGKRKFFDNTIYTFDIETTSFLILNGKMIPACDYLKLTKEEQEKSIFMSNMYIWMFSINDVVYYGRTWTELRAFLLRVETWGTKVKKFCYVHNLPYEFEFLRNCLQFKNVFARKSRKPIKFELDEFNFEFRCSYILTNSKLEDLPKNYGFEDKVKKLTGNLDYTKIRNSKTILTDDELKYCENDCLVIYEYIKKELETYKTIKGIPLTNTGHVRKELKEKTMKNYPYRNKVRKAINTDGHIYNMLLRAFQGGYTHANWYFASTIIKGDIDSWDFTSSYPYVMSAFKFPSTKFKPLKIKKKEQMIKQFAYLIHVKFYNIECKYLNTFISASKCLNIKKGKYDNGRVIKADEVEIILTDIDFNFICKAYGVTDNYEFVEIYYSLYDYLPIDFVEFVLEKYKNKTKYKNVEGKEVIYSIEKSKFNALYRNDCD